MGMLKMNTQFLVSWSTFVTKRVKSLKKNYFEDCSLLSWSAHI